MDNAITFFDSIVLGLVQGLTEFIPVSSSGHLIIAREWLGISANGGLGFDAVLQLATILAVLVYFWKDLWGLFVAFIKWVIGKGIEDDKRTMILAIIVGTIPAVILGLFLEDYMETIFRSTTLVALTLVIGAIIFWLAEYFVKTRLYKGETFVQSGDRMSDIQNTGYQISGISVLKGFWIGCFQVLALVPGMSRSGMTISGGLFVGLTREMATRFSFLLAFPIILGSGLKKFIDIAGTGELSTIGPELLIASLVAFISGLFAIHFLITFLKKHSLIPFAIYRVLLAVALIVFSL